ncbi:MAG: hypothetical protein KGJ02_03380 [Verrucomicrobiota bacterium]|nr:hypothetical protein [Verrucomicrobiota bacterium]
MLANQQPSLDLQNSSLALIASRLRILRSLQVANNPLLTDKELEEVLSHCKQLENFDLQNCPKIGDKTLHALTDKVCTLRALRWIGNGATAPATYLRLAKNCPRLCSLNLSGCSSFSTDICRSLLASCPSLAYLDLSFCPLEDGAFASANPSLTFLNLQGCTTLTDHTLRHLARLPSLRHLYLAFNDRITKNGLRALSHLKTLKLYACKNVL